MTKRRTVFMFSGQGSPYYQMGRALFDNDHSFRTWMLRMDDVVREQAGYSVLEVLYSDAYALSGTFEETMLSHPAIFMVEFAVARSLLEQGIEPDLLLGASLGTFTAAAVAGMVDWDDALRSVVAQVSILQRCCEKGGMIAVLADSRVHETEPLRSCSEIAGINFPGHFVLAVPAEHLKEVEAALVSMNVTAQRLPVSFPFHSRWIEAAQQPFLALMDSLKSRHAKWPVLCCAGSQALTKLPESHFWRVIRQPIQFQKTILSLEAQDAQRYLDVGPSGTLATFVKYALPRESRSSVRLTLSRFGGELQNLARIVAETS